jgi:cold shock CspA family protein
MRGSITRVSRKDGSGCILAKDGKEICFERSEASSNGVEELRVGHWVEFELQYGFERPCAVNVKRLQRRRPNVQEHRVSRDRGLPKWS